MSVVASSTASLGMTDEASVTVGAREAVSAMTSARESKEDWKERRRIAVLLIPFIDEINAATVATEEARLKAEEAAAGKAGVNCC